MFGAFLPWVMTAVGNASGARGAGLYAFYAAVLGIAGAIVRKPRWAAAHAAVLALVAVVLPVWQVVHLAGLVGFSGWMPGPGLVLVFGGGVLAGSAALALFRTPVTPPPG